MRLVYLHNSNISSFERRELVSNLISALELVPENTLTAIRKSLEKQEVMDSAKIKKITGLDGQGLESILLLFNNAATRTDMLLIAIDTALAVMQNAKRESETVDLSWTGPIQFSVEGRTTPSVIEEMILNAKDSIIITSYNITYDAESFIRLLENAIDKVEIIFVIHNDKKTRTLKPCQIYGKKKKSLKYILVLPDRLTSISKYMQKCLSLTIMICW